jgi:hypothetical protein
MPPSLSQSDSTFEQQTTNLVDDGRAAHDPALTHPVQRLHIQLLIGLDRHKAHRWSCHGLCDGLCIDVVVLVRLHVRLHILGWHQSHLVALAAQRPAEQMCAAASFHANQVDLQVRGEAQQLRARKLLAHHNFATPVLTNHMKDGLAKINADRV